MSRPEGGDLVLLYTRKCSEVWTHCSLLMLLLLSRCLHILQLQHLTLNMVASTLRAKVGWWTSGLTHFQLNWDYELGTIRRPCCVLCVCGMQPGEEEHIIGFYSSYTVSAQIFCSIIHQGGVCLRYLLSLPCFLSVRLGPAARHWSHKCWVVVLNGCVKVSGSILLLL